MQAPGGANAATLAHLLSAPFLQAQGRELAQAGLARDKQMTAQDALPTLRQHVLEGRYVEAVALANQLLGLGEPRGFVRNSVITLMCCVPLELVWCCV
ncbi:MAG TPA: hypothetical protein VFN67_41735 [Polyangiales bacterium]|nr:hypothetical protein [Polyangiales bacterium]